MKITATTATGLPKKL